VTSSPSRVEVAGGASEAGPPTTAPPSTSPSTRRVPMNDRANVAVRFAGRAIPVCAVRHERFVVRDVGRIWALGSFVCIPVPKILPRARMHPEKARPPGPVSG
jgi:hypothetical protein